MNRLRQFLRWLDAGDVPLRPLPPGWVRVAGVLMVIYAAAQPVATGVSTVAAGLLTLIWMMGWVRGWFRLTPIALLVLLLFGAFFLALIANPVMLQVAAQRLQGVQPSESAAADAKMQFSCLSNYWHFLLLPAGILWAGLGWHWFRRALLALGISALVTMLTALTELVTRVNFRWDILGPGAKRAGLLGLIGRETVDKLPENRAYGFFDHPLTYGGFLAVIFFLFAGLFLYGRKSSSPRAWKFHGLLAVLGGLLMLVAKNRSYWVGGLMGCLPLARGLGRRTLAGLAVAGALLFTLFYFTAPTFRFRVNGIFIPYENRERHAFWRSGLDMVADKPLCGWGVCGYRLQGEPYRAVYGKDFSNFTHVHNSYLQVMVEGGALQLLAFLMILALLVRKLWRRTAGGVETSGSVALARGMLAALLCFMTAALFEWNFGDKEPAMTLFILLGAALHLPEQEKEV